MHCAARGNTRDEKLQGVRLEVQPLGLVRLQNSRYAGFEDIPGEIELTAGHWEGEPVNGRVTLSYSDGAFRGNAGCNDYSAPVSAVESRGSIGVGEARSTRRQCCPDAMANEQRFLSLLPHVNRFWFHAGQLALAYGEGVAFGVMFLSKEDR